MAKPLIVALSGEICSGKTTLARRLLQDFGFEVFSTRQVLEDLYRGKEKASRVTLQHLGERLDDETNGLWVVRSFQEKVFPSLGQSSCCVIDAVRIPNQLVELRRAFGPSVVHVHLVCSIDTLSVRFGQKYGLNKDNGTTQREYSVIKANSTEKQVSRLKVLADLVIDTDRSNEKDVGIRVASYLGLLANHQRSVVDVVVGGQFGSEGKGQICAYLAPEYDALVRVGGPNAGHTVFADPPQKFHLIPSGATRAPNALLIIGPGAVLDLTVLKKEIAESKIGTDRLKIDYNATIITEEDKQQEKKLVATIGSTGQGVGAATARNIILRSAKKLNKAVKFEKLLRGYLGSAHYELERLFRRNAKVLLEGTQGAGLSLHHGFYPYVTSRDTTVSGCLAESGIAPKRVRQIIMVTRTYPIRVQNPKDRTSGPFESSELSWEIISKRSGIPREDLEESEMTTTTHKRRRVAEFSWALFRKACELNSPTDIALTFVDYVSDRNEKARRFEQLTDETIMFVEEVERCAGAPVSLISTRFQYRCIIDRRNWKC